MSPPKKKVTSTRHAKAKRAARRSGRRARVKRAALRSAGLAPRMRAGSAAAQHGAKGGAKRRPKGDVKGRPRGGGPEKSASRAASGRPAGPTKQDAPRPKLSVVARPAPAKPKRPARIPEPITEFSGAKAGASRKDLALFGLERARVAVNGAIQGLGAGAANRPIAPGKWSPRQMVIHLAFWDREIVQKHLEAAAARNQRADIRRSQLDAMNTAGIAALEHHDWEAAKRLLQSTHEDLWDALDSIPAEPAEVWSPEHAVGELVREVTDHDRHHADILKRWRAETGA